MTSILAEGETCWRMAEADRFSVIVDAGGFFRQARRAMLKAKRSIILIGWDFDTRIRLSPDEPDDGVPDKLGRFLEHLAKRDKDLQIRILKWDVGLLSSITRGETPFHMLRWMLSKQIHLKLDRAHPPLAAHHMKLLVIDDALAFCGGIDMTVGRWDTREHAENDPNRLSPFGRPEPPWHDATTCTSGAAARALGDLARDRWRMATGETLAPVDPDEADSDYWPQDLPTDFRHVTIGIARTSPKYEDRREVVEIETATLAMIAAARDSLYVESQYFASRRIAEAMAKRLEEPNGPEIVIINPKSASGWLEEKTMDTARAKLMRLLKSRDRFGRFRIFYPVNAQETPIYVHAKIMIADDRILKLGSANLNNRSMGYDTESDVILEVGEEDEGLRKTIRARRDDLLAEHLGETVEAVTAAIDRADGSLISAIAALSRPDGRGLRPVGERKLRADDELVAESDLVDPERPAGVRYRTSRFLRNKFGRRMFASHQG
ncbi:phospholipase D-like domain-containing protein [Rhizobium sp. SSA_523]|uniref:phospholipase D-like domain-containing protein n=1 Tax=Rhizobium sp. SSA_523 TaxID=2952477 RepID=UPI00209193C4|nr:phospholipase D-like domain-containing protein [Rhizobium sp. SSA_523]MCO5730933.1 phospholipase D-like domain-containing protein [Rhizobium sp. SSA_523]WKC24255.1 phospholipase D-like domain-containing protein [Rhizobium sp. SSA_523]